MENEGIAEDICLWNSDETLHSHVLLQFIYFKKCVLSPSAEKAHTSLGTGIV